MPLRGIADAALDIEGSWLKPAERGLVAPTLGT